MPSLRKLALLALLLGGGLSVEGAQCHLLLLGAGTCGAAASFDPEDGLEVYYDAEGAGGTPLVDVHGTYDLTETSGTIDTATGKVGAARDFEATAETEYFTAATNAVVEFGDEDFTIALWVKPESTAAIVDFVSKFDNSNYLIGEGGDAKPRFLVRNAGDTANITVTSTVVMSPATWYFIVARHDATADTIDITVGDAGTLTTSSPQTVTGGISNEATAFAIGARPTPTVYTDGILDEIGIWSRKLTSDEMTWLYNTGSGRSYANIVAHVP